MNLYDVIIKPLITEKGTNLKEDQNKIILMVDINANKLEIKQAVETTLKAKVDKVATIRLKGKKKRMGARMGKRSDWKKAVVTLKEGEKVDYLEGVAG